MTDFGESQVTGSAAENAEPLTGFTLGPHAFDDAHNQTEFDKEPVSGGQRSATLQSGGDYATGSRHVPANGPVSAKQRGKPREGAANRIRLAFESCMAAVDRAIEGEGDPIERGNAIFDLREALERLWQERNTRENQFGDLVNLLQGITHNVEAEDVTDSHIEAIGSVVREMACLSRLANADIRDAHRILTKAGCDVFRFLR